MVTSRCPGSAAALRAPACTLYATRSNADSFPPASGYVATAGKIHPVLCFGTGVCACYTVQSTTNDKTRDPVLLLATRGKKIFSSRTEQTNELCHRLIGLLLIVFFRSKFKEDLEQKKKPKKKTAPLNFFNLRLPALRGSNIITLIHLWGKVG